MASFNSKSIFKYASKSDIIKIIILTSIIFIILQFIRITFIINNERDDFFFNHIYNKVTLPTTFKQLLYQPWALITYIFSDLSFMRILGNMIWLWIFATVIEDLKGSNRILPIFLAGGIVGGLFLLTFNMIKPNMALSNYGGALAAVSAIAVATVMFKPSYKFSMFFGLEIPIWVFAAIFFALNIATVQSNTLAILFLTIGGVLVGLGYTNILSSFFEKASYYFTKFGNYFSNNRNFVLEEKHTTRNKTVFNISSYKPKSIDDILDKINEKGLDALSKEEKKQLEQFSKNT